MDEVKLLPCDRAIIERCRELLAIWEAAPFGEISKQEHDAHHELMKMGPTLARITIEATRPPIVTDEVVERVGRAISTAANDEISSVTCEIYARSAIAAMLAIDQDGGEG